MSSNITAESLTREKQSFWKRQFATHTSEAQATCDIAFGLIAPILCFYFDPIVFKGGFGPPLLGSYQLFAYAVTALQISLFVIWIVFGSRLEAWLRIIGGALISGAIFSAVIGLLILPYSLMGLMVVIGALGFIPFITGFIYLRVGWRAINQEQSAVTALINPLLAGAILSLGIPALLSLYITRATANSIDAILHGSPQEAEVAVGHLRWLPFIPEQNLEPLVQSYINEKDPVRREILKQNYQTLTGQDLDVKVAIVND